MKQIILKGLGLIVLLVVTISSCKKDESSSIDALSYTELSVYQMQDECALGKMGCYELVFPISIQFPDNTTLAVNSYEELKAGIKAWKEANDPKSGRPQFVFPFSVINDKGETIVVSSEEDFKALREACPQAKHPGHKGHFKRGLNCFDLVFPVTLTFPDSSELIVNSKDELKEALITWHKANPKVKNHPVLKFPFTVTLKSDGSSVTVSTKEDLHQLKESCRG